MHDDDLVDAAHAMHVGWVRSELEFGGFLVRYVPHDDGGWTCRLRIVQEDPANSFDLIVPPPS